MLRSIFSTIWFNFHYLPFNQAVKLPILLYKPKLLSCKGEIAIEADQVKFGMIRLGEFVVSIYPNSGVVFENDGGRIIFKGKCDIGGGSAISIGECGEVIFGDKFSSLSTLKLVCYNSIYFSDRVRFGWDSIVMDTDFHKLTKLSGGYSKGYGRIHIGSDNWFGCKCSVFKNSETPNFCTISSGSIITKKLDFPEYSLIGAANSVELKAHGLFRNIDDSTIDYR